MGFSAHTGVKRLHLAQKRTWRTPTHTINVHGVIFQQPRRFRCKAIHFSTDKVFHKKLSASALISFSQKTIHFSTDKFLMQSYTVFTREVSVCTQIRML